MAKIFEPKPFTPQQRRIIVNIAKARVYNNLDKWPPETEARDKLRWDATLRKVEEELAAVTKERDEYYRIADIWVQEEGEGAEALAAVRGAQCDREEGIS